MRLAIAACVLLLGCGGRQPAPAAARIGDDITLYRDLAVIRQRVELDVGAKPATLTVTIAAGVAAHQIMLIDRGGLEITAVHAKTDPDANLADDAQRLADVLRGGNLPDIDIDSPGPDDEAEEAPADEPETPPAFDEPRRDAKPTELRLDVKAPRAGKYAIVIGYVTNRLRWDVAYTMTASPRRDRGQLRGALAIKNLTGVTLRAANARLVDADLGAWRGKTAEHLATSLVGGAQPSNAPATPRELGAIEIGSGETRIELMAPATRTMRSVLVYDPIGSRLDNPGAAPLRDARLGLDPPAPTRVSESFEVARDVVAAAGLPAGPVRLLERRSDGSLVVLGEARLFEASSRVANVDTIAVGTADSVTGSRERRELTIDDEHRRIVEEFVITLDNKREAPASVLVREHLYRGQNWTLAYHSAVAAAKEGAQQISLRAEVPAKSQLKILYVVVYTWGQ
ncbi:MAG TPA: hypothetical protein VIV11_42770 [Kofleriaceae bacterium]